MKYCAFAQYNINRLVTAGKSALYYEDYVLSIQYFNQAISSKPFLYEPWYLRGVAKFYLDDYTGAEADCSKALNLNPYVTGIYELRGLCRIRQNNFKGAIADYDKTILYNPDNKSLWYNRVLCRIEDKQYEGAHHDLDSMIRRWDTFAKAYALKAETYFQQKDTIQAATFLDKTLKLDPYDADAWTMRAMISLSKENWKDADQQLSKVIHLRPTKAGNYVNRALARYKVNNLRGALADYDKAIELDPNNFLAHYNRAQLRVQVGDDNRAISDFDFIIRLEPDNVMAIYNRALLRERTGDIYGAISDYSAVIKQFPNFWAGLSSRAKCYRMVGLTAKAENDEFRIFNAQMQKHYGVQKRWSRKKLRSVRKKSDIDLDKYNQLVVADDEGKMEHQYSSEYRGKVQNRKVEAEFMPMFMLTYVAGHNGVNAATAFVNEVESFNHNNKPARNLLVSCNTKRLNGSEADKFFFAADSLSKKIRKLSRVSDGKALIMQRSVMYSLIQNYEDAISDLDVYIETDSTSSMAYWHRGVCLSLLNATKLTKIDEIRLAEQRVLDNLSHAAALSPDNAYIHYDMACVYINSKSYDKAIAALDKAISLNPQMAEAYYNRGLAKIYADDKAGGTADLSKAGELGLFDAYSLIKKYK